LNKFETFRGNVVPGAIVPGTPPTTGGAPPAAASQGETKSKLQARKANSKEFAALEVEDDVEEFLEHHPYVKGFLPTSADVDLYNQLCERGFPETPNLKRWLEHVGTFTAQERAGWASEN